MAPSYIVHRKCMTLATPVPGLAEIQTLYQLLPQKRVSVHVAQAHLDFLNVWNLEVKQVIVSQALQQENRQQPSINLIFHSSDIIIVLL